MGHREWERLGAASGIAAVLVFFTAMMLPGTLATDASAVEVRDWMLDKHDQLIAQAVLLAFGALLFLFFIATMRNVLRRTESGTGELSAIMSGSALISIAMMLICISAIAGVAYRAAADLDPNVVRFVWDTANIGFAFVGVPSAVFLASAAVLMRRSEVFPMWMPTAAGVAAVMNVLAPASLFFSAGAWGPLGVVAYLSPITFMLVILGSGVVLARHPEAGDARMPAMAMGTAA